MWVVLWQQSLLIGFCLCLFPRCKLSAYISVGCWLFSPRFVHSRFAHVHLGWCGSHVWRPMLWLPNLLSSPACDRLSGYWCKAGSVYIRWGCDDVPALLRSNNVFIILQARIRLSENIKLYVFQIGKIISYMSPVFVAFWSEYNVPVHVATSLSIRSITGSDIRPSFCDKSHRQVFHKTYADIIFQTTAWIQAAREWFSSWARNCYALFLTVFPRYQPSITEYGVDVAGR